MRKRLSLLSKTKLSLAKAIGRFVPSCQEATRLISDSMEEKLPWKSKFRLAIHLLMCKWCQRFKQQWRQIRALIRKTRAEDDSVTTHPPVTLSDSARKRMQRALGSSNK